MMTALAARYDVITHDISSRLAENDPCMCGSATFVMEVSSTCITVTIITENVMAHLRPELMGGAGGTLLGFPSNPEWAGGTRLGFPSTPEWEGGSLTSGRARSARRSRSARGTRARSG